MGQKNKLPASAVVGIVDSPEAWRVAARLGPGALGALEWRADCLPDAAAIPPSLFPWILTVRHPREGGRGGLSTGERQSLFLRLLPGAAFVDVELRSLRGLRRIREEAANRKIRLIVSFHDFSGASFTPAKLRGMALRAADAGADVFKIAIRTATPRDVARLLELFSCSPLPLAVMGMGPLGFSSRLLFASCGSVFNYGWLHRANVPGQWPALELQKMLERR
ncbi:MAG: type I 3-dehydroquinate dehydratase [Verrucomicrobiae bacterium]